MKLELTHAETTYYFEDDSDPDEYIQYRRDSLGNWEQRTGENWEPVYDSAKLEEDFQAIKAKYAKE